MSRQLAIFADSDTLPSIARWGERVKKSSRKSPAGISTNQLVFTAYQGTSEDVFPNVVSLYVAQGSTVADVTYGKGVFWKRVPEGKYRLLATDLRNGVDCRNLP